LLVLLNPVCLPKIRDKDSGQNFVSTFGGKTKSIIMANRYFTCLAAAILVWLFTGCSAPSRVNDTPKNSAGTGDKVISDMREHGLSKSTHFYLTEINSKAMRNFIISYPNATDPKWVTYSAGYVVYFMRDCVRGKVYYTRSGEHKCTIQQYSAEYMPLAMRQLVENTFKDYSVFLVTEVTKRGKTRYEIKIEDESSFKEIKIEDGGVRVTNEFVKSQPTTRINF